MDVDECVAYLRRFLEEGRIPGLAPSDELLARFREECAREFDQLRRWGLKSYLSARPTALGLQARPSVRGVREEPRALPCAFAFFILCQKLESEGTLKVPAAEAYERFDNWLREQLGSER